MTTKSWEPIGLFNVELETSATIGTQRTGGSPLRWPPRGRRHIGSCGDRVPPSPSPRASAVASEPLPIYFCLRVTRGDDPRAHPGGDCPRQPIRQGHCGHCADTAFSKQSVMALSA